MKKIARVNNDILLKKNIGCEKTAKAVFFDSNILICYEDILPVWQDFIMNNRIGLQALDVNEDTKLIVALEKEA